MHNYGTFDRFVRTLTSAVPTLWAAFEQQCRTICGDLRTASSDGLEVLASHLFGTVRLSPIESALYASPFMQRLQRLYQAPTFAFAYPSATHDRLQASLETLACTHAYLDLLNHKSEEMGLGPCGTDDIQAIRLAALLNRVASCPYTYVLWPVIEEEAFSSFATAKAILYETFGHSRHVDAQDVASCLIITSSSFQALLTGVIGSEVTAKELSLKTMSALLGSPNFLTAGYLTDVLHGPVGSISVSRILIDAFHAGLPLAVDLARLISSFKLTKVRDDRVRGPSFPPVVISISEERIPVIEQFGLAREMLEYRVSNHHITLLVHTMVREIARCIAKHKLPGIAVSDIIADVTDRAFVERAMQNAPTGTTLGRKIRGLAARLFQRNLPTRVLAFGPAYYVGYESATPADKADTEAMVTRELQMRLSDPTSLGEIQLKILKRARSMVSNRSNGPKISESDVVILPPRLRPFGVRGLPVETRDGGLQVADKFFDPSLWTSAYRSKPPGYVYWGGPMPLEVQAAARITFEEEFGLRLSEDADFPVRLPKVSSDQNYFPTRSPGLLEPVGRERRYITPSEIRLPAAWLEHGSLVRDELSRKLRLARQEGFARRQKRIIVRLIDALSSFQNMSYLGGTLKGLGFGDEARLQLVLRDHLRSAGFEITEGVAVGGGKLDLLFEQDVPIEVKIYSKPTDSPMQVGTRFALQARRYALALSKTIVATVIGYRPNSEVGHRAAADLIDVRRTSDRRIVEIRAAVPIGFDVPSHATRYD